MRNYLLGIDAGTTAIKAVLFDEEGKVLSSGLQEYTLQTGDGDRVETDPQVYWSSLKSALEQVFSTLEDKYRNVAALAISSQGESFICIDSQGKPLRNTIVWLDNRSKKQAAKIDKEFGSQQVYQTTGSPEVNSTWASTKLLWMRDYESDLFDRVHKVLFVEDYLIWRLTGQFAANGALYCSSLLYNIHTDGWWTEMLDYLGLRRDQLCDLYPSGVNVGSVSRAMAAELGFANEPNVVTAGMDQACGCIGTGNITSGFVTENTGASLNISATLDQPVFDPKQRVPLQTHAIKGKYIYLPWCPSGGMIMKWFRDRFCLDMAEQAHRQGRDAYDLMTLGLESIPPGSDGAMVLPHLSGALSPEMDPDARAVFFGLDLSHRRDHILRAILESVAYLSRSNIELIQEAGIDVKTVILTGGAAKSPLWNQIKADVMGLPLQTIRNQESGCLGAAILAGCGTGVYDSVEEACGAILEKDTCYRPDSAAHKAYEHYYATYRRLYETVKPLFKSHRTIQEERNTP